MTFFKHTEIDMQNPRAVMFFWCTFTEDFGEWTKDEFVECLVFEPEIGVLYQLDIHNEIIKSEYLNFEKIA